MRARAPYLWICGLVAMLAAGGCGGAMSSLSNGPPLVPGSGSGSSPSGSSPIKHVILVVQENRSFDNFFALFPGADGATRGKMKIKRGGKYVDKWVTLQSHALVTPTDIQHCYASFLTDYDGGKMDGFGSVYRGVCGAHGQPIGKLAYQYVQESQIQPYWDIAQQWVLADQMYQTQGSGSFTAHQDLIRGGTAIDSSDSLIDNPTQMPWGCDYLGQSLTSLITTTGKYLKNQGPPPCTSKFPGSGSSYRTLRDLLDAKSVSWKYYSPCFHGWNPSGCDNGCDYTCSGSILNAFDVIWPVRNGAEWGTNVSMPETNIFSDITGSALPAVSWVIPDDANSDHPGETCKCDTGPSWVASVVDAIGQSSYWSSSVIVVVWDDWGGFYDDAAPPKQNKQGGLGFRIPMLIISPYAKAGSGSQGGSISHTQYEFGSLLKYIEQNWNLGSLHTTDEGSNSIGDVFDYSQQPRTFKKIQSPLSIKYFESRRSTVQHGDPE
jgi:phospholipase C